MDTVWKRIDAWLAAYAPGVAATLQAGATESRLQGAEAALGATLPEDVRASYRVHDGQEPGADGLTVDGDLLPLADVIEEWKVWKGLLEGGDLGDNHGEPEGPVRADYWNVHWIPLVHDGAGNHLCLDMAPAPGGQVGQIITMWHDSPEREVVAPSFRAWLTQFADDLDAGEYVLSDKYGGLVRRDDV